MEAIQVFDRPASQAFYTVAGRLLFIESFNPQLRNLIGLLFSGWQLTPVPSAERSPDIHISFFCGAQPPDIPSHLNQFEIAGDGHCYTNAGEMYLAVHDSLVHLRDTEPVAVDNEHRLKEAFQNDQGYVPAYYLFDAEGKLKSFAAGERGLDMLDSALERLLTPAPVAVT